jgi:C-terminal processing protease CtpA/Prc
MFCCSSRDDDKKSQQQRSIDNNNREQNQQTQQNQHNNNTRPVALQNAAQPSGKPVGVGIVFQPDSTGALHVKSLAVNGPAEKSGQVLPALLLPPPPTPLFQGLSDQ